MSELDHIRQDDIFQESSQYSMRSDSHPDITFPWFHKNYPVMAYYWRELILQILSVAFVGIGGGITKLAFPFLGSIVFQQDSSEIQAFIVTFGCAKGLCSVQIGVASDDFGRTNMLRLGWLFGMPVFPVIMLGNSWDSVVFANLLMGVQQGICWSGTIYMMVDLATGRNKAQVVALNEFIGFMFIATITLASSFQKSNTQTIEEYYPVFILGLVVLALGFAVSQILPETKGLNHAPILQRHHRLFAVHSATDVGSETESNSEYMTDHSENDDSLMQLDALQSAETHSLRPPLSDDVEQGTILLDESSNIRYRHTTAYVSRGPFAHEEALSTTSIFQPAPAPACDTSTFATLFFLLIDAAKSVWNVSFHTMPVFTTCLVGFMSSAQDGLVWGLAPLYYKSFNLTVLEVGQIVSLYFYSLAVGQIISGNQADKGASKTVLIIGIFLEVIAVVFTAIMPALTLYGAPAHKAYYLFLVGSAQMGIGQALMVPPLHHNMLVEFPSNIQSSVLGVLRMWRGFGTAFGAGMGAILQKYYSFSTTFLCAAGTLLITGLFALYFLYEIRPVKYSSYNANPANSDSARVDRISHDLPSPMSPSVDAEADFPEVDPFLVQRPSPIDYSYTATNNDNQDGLIELQSIPTDDEEFNKPGIY